MVFWQKNTFSMEIRLFAARVVYTGELRYTEGSGGPELMLAGRGKSATHIIL